MAALAALQPGDVVEVHGATQSDNTVLATLIERKSGNHTPRVVGRLSQLDTAARTFHIGTLRIDYASARVSGNLANGRLVSVKAIEAPVNNVLRASAIKTSGEGAHGAALAAGTYLKLKGVAEAAPNSGLLTVSGTRVDVSQAVVEYGPIVAGAFLEVKGSWNGSVLMASKVEVERSRPGASADRNELYGAVSQLTHEGGRTMATVSGVMVDVSQAYFSKGSLAQLAVGSVVEVKGYLQGTLFIATKVELKSGRDADGYSYEHYGQVSDFVSVSDFKVNGVRVDASGARFEDGSAASLANGIYVEIKGAQNAAGVLVASKVEIKRGRGY
ncbi:DUF5666 domain-containing protein [Ottowia testudinis]|uniref:DUF5666 domain-containing protein n=1 Tax=Ottowia testudinis TaxID=2816950 RepID=A0A975H2A6_9BURK|nr:DUF5666 domain-containing protein [Ottowia testudinis]QTD43980.1 hypothetical protein J1M35_12605 [Ottowia testudinis]